jgi:hypothetical protein
MCSAFTSTCSSHRTLAFNRLCLPLKEELLLLVFDVIGSKEYDGVRYADLRELDELCEFFCNAKVSSCETIHYLVKVFQRGGAGCIAGHAEHQRTIENGSGEVHCLSPGEVQCGLFRHCFLVSGSTESAHVSRWW